MEEKEHRFFDKSALATMLGGFLVALLLMGSIFVYKLENPNIEERRVGQILEEPNTFYGSTVSVQGEVEKVFGTQVITLGKTDAVGDELLVISQQSLEPVGGSGIPESIFSPMDAVRVEGQVREFDLHKVEKELGRDLDDELFLAWQGRPFVYASDVALQEE